VIYRHFLIAISRPLSISQLLYDRMNNVYIGKIAGEKKFNDTLLGFALHYGFKPEVAPLRMRPG